MILTYILTFSLLIMSVIKVTDLFLKADQHLNEKRSEFIHQTKKTHQKGNITLMAALLTLMISALLMFFALKFKVELTEARYRKDSYLCFHYMNTETENYIQDISKFNWALRTAFAALFSGIATVEAKAAFEALKIARNGRHFYYVKKLFSNPYCKGEIPLISYIKNFPYQVTPALTLITNPDATTKVKEAQWKNTYYQNPTGIRSKNSFCLEAQMSMEGPFIPNFKIKTTEIPMGGFSKLKCLSGFPSSF